MVVHSNLSPARPSLAYAKDASRALANARPRPRARLHALSRASDVPFGYQTFAHDATIELAIKCAESPDDETSVEAWLEEPRNFINVVFGAAEARARLGERGERGGVVYDVCVTPRRLFSWEIAPEFSIEAIGGGKGDEKGASSASPSGTAASSSYGRARLIGRGLKFGGDRTRLPPGFKNMGVWAHIDATVSAEKARKGETTVTTEVSVLVAADVPGILRAIPGFSSAGVMAIAKSIDIVSGGIAEATQATYDAWVEEQKKGLKANDANA